MENTANLSVVSDNQVQDDTVSQEMARLKAENEALRKGKTESKASDRVYAGWDAATIITTWNAASSVKDAATSLGMKIGTLEQRIYQLRKKDTRLDAKIKRFPKGRGATLNVETLLATLSDVVK